MIWIVVILALFIFQMITILLCEFRRPDKTVAWLMVLVIFPLIGFIMYYFMAKEYTRRRKVKRKTRKMMKEIRRDLFHKLKRENNRNKERQEIEEDVRLYGLLSNLPGSPLTACNETEVYSSGEETYEAILQAMEQATDHIHLEYYIIRDDGIGRRFQDVLIRKAREGVEVRLLYDGIGSIDLPESYIGALHKAGVETGCFLPPFIAFMDKRINYRNHRKTVVVDGVVGFLGGINIGDEYLGKHPRLGYWRDTHLKITGDAVYYLQNTFIRDWYYVKGKVLDDPRYFPEHECSGEDQVQIVVSGPDAHWDTIQEVYFSAIASAKHRIYIETPYFIPDPGINLALKTAAVSGVDVRIILPETPDSKVVFWASLSFAEDLLQAGVRFYLYTKGFIHSKVLIADHKLASVGTANMDVRSFFSNFEMNANFFDRHIINRLEKDFHQDMKDSRELMLSEFERRSRWQKTKEMVSRVLSHLF